MRILKTVASLLVCALALPGAWSCKKPDDGGDDSVHVKEVVLSETAITIGPGAIHTLTATIKPNNAANKNILWESADKTIATVDNGEVKGIKDGVTTVTATALDGFVTAGCQVTVKTVNATSVNLDVSGELMMTVGQTRQLKATMKPDNATVGITFSSSNPKAATVDAYSGLVTAKAEGKTTITAASTDGKAKAYVNISVYNEIIYPTSIDIIFPEDIQINKNYILKYKNIDPSSDRFKIVFHPDNANMREVQVSSDNTGILYTQQQLVDDGGNFIITGKSVGKTNLRVQTQNGKIYSKPVNIWAKEPKISIDQANTDYWFPYYTTTDLWLNVGGYSHTLKVNYENITDKSVTFETGFPEYIDLSSAGVVKAKAVSSGTPSIFAYSKNNPGVFTMVYFHTKKLDGLDCSEGTSTRIIKYNKTPVKLNINGISVQRQAYKVEGDGASYVTVTADATNNPYGTDPSSATMNPYGVAYTITAKSNPTSTKTGTFTVWLKEDTSKKLSINFEVRPN